MKGMFNRAFWIEWGLVALAVASIAVAFLWSWLLPDQGVRFQRAGAVMVLFAALLEFRQARGIAEQYANDIVVSVIAEVPALSACRERKAFQSVAMVAGLLGTLIWGFGDLLFFWQETAYS
nr:hypothetical protein [Halomonas socia]